MAHRPEPLDRRFPTARRLITLWLVGIGCGALVVGAGAVALAAPLSQAEQFASRTQPAAAHLSAVEASALRSQAAFLQALDTTGASRSASLASAQSTSQQADTSWVAYVRVAGHTPEETALQRRFEADVDASRQAGAQLIGMPSGAPVYARTLDKERSSSQAQIDTLTQLQAMYAPIVEQAGPGIRRGIRQARTVVVLTSGLLFGLFSVLTAIVVRRAREEENGLRAEATNLRAAGDAARFESALQRGLDMASTESGAFEVIRRALSMVGSGGPTEVLIADSSHAHFRQVVWTDTAGTTGCSVGAPSDCPVTTGGASHTCEDSAALDACRFVREGRSQAWAVCVPLSVAGRAVGVIHVHGSEGSPWNDRLPGALAVVARRAGDRIGALRVLLRSESQAQTDPLTGLPNRRTLDEHLQRLVAGCEPHVVAFADLDGFKTINDVQGHEAGDRALMVFGRVLRDSVRPEDFLCRYGGDEFVVVLPDCTIAAARAVAERIRSGLESTLARTDLPRFTVTVGLTASDPGGPFADTLARADATMLRAKALGRDRVLASSDPSVQPETAGSPTADQPTPPNGGPL